MENRKLGKILFVLLCNIMIVLIPIISLSTFFSIKRMGDTMNQINQTTLFYFFMAEATIFVFISFYGITIGQDLLRIDKSILEKAKGMFKIKILISTVFFIAYSVILITSNIHLSIVDFKISIFENILLGWLFSTLGNLLWLLYFNKSNYIQYKLNIAS